MLDFFGHEEWGTQLIHIIEDILNDGSVLTPDLGGSTKTREVGDAVAERLEAFSKRSRV